MFRFPHTNSFSEFNDTLAPRGPLYLNMLAASPGTRPEAGLPPNSLYTSSVIWTPSSRVGTRMTSCGPCDDSLYVHHGTVNHMGWR